MSPIFSLRQWTAWARSPGLMVEGASTCSLSFVPHLLVSLWLKAWSQEIGLSSSVLFLGLFLQDLVCFDFPLISCLSASMNNTLVLVSTVHLKEKNAHIYWICESVFTHWFFRAPECSHFPRKPSKPCLVLIPFPRMPFCNPRGSSRFLWSYLKLSLDVIPLLGRTQGLPGTSLSPRTSQLALGSTCCDGHSVVFICLWFFLGETVSKQCVGWMPLLAV